MSITPKQSEALHLQDKGLTYKQIADLLGITETAVEARLARARHRLDIPVLRLRKRATGPTERQEQVLSLRRKGFTYRQIAAQLGINRETVKRHMQKARIQEEEGNNSMSMTLPRLSALVHGWAETLHKDIREYYYKPGSTDKQLIEADIKNVRDALDMLELELNLWNISTNEEHTA